MPTDLLVVMADLLLKFLDDILMVVYLLLVVFGGLLPQLGKFLFLLKLEWRSLLTHSWIVES